MSWKPFRLKVKFPIYLCYYNKDDSKLRVILGFWLIFIFLYIILFLLSLKHEQVKKFDIFINFWVKIFYLRVKMKFGYRNAPSQIGPLEYEIQRTKIHEKSWWFSCVSFKQYSLNPTSVIRKFLSENPSGAQRTSGPIWHFDPGEF